jgi:hypothetical protein
MRHKLQDITLYYNFDNDEVKRRFSTRANVVSDLYVHFLEGYKPAKTSRISVTLKSEGMNLNEPVHFGSILNADAILNKEKFWQQNEAVQKEIILNTIHQTAIGCADKFKWDKEVFHRAYQKVKDADFIFKVETNAKLSPDKKLKAALAIEKTEEKTIISANFYDHAGKLLTTIPLFDSFQNEMFYGALVRNFQWFSNSEFGVCSKTRELKILGDFTTGQSKIVIEPDKNSREAIEGQLRYVLYRELKTHNDIVEWANK